MQHPVGMHSLGNNQFNVRLVAALQWPLADSWLSLLLPLAQVVAQQLATHVSHGSKTWSCKVAEPES